MLTAAATVLAADQGRGGLELRAWKLDPETGDYYIEATIDNERQRAVFTPGTYIAPRITATVTRQGREFLFAYEIANGVGVRQSIRACAFVVAFPAEATATPRDWMLMKTPTRDRLTWVQLVGEYGVPPGRSQQGFALKAAALPGVRQAECRGARPVAAVESWFSDEARRELDRLLERNQVSVPIIGPALAVKPDEDVATIFSRIRAHFAGQLDGFEAAERERIIARLVSIERMLRQRQFAGARADIGGLLASLDARPSDWSGQVLGALRADLAFVQSRLESTDSR